MDSGRLFFISLVLAVLIACAPAAHRVETLPVETPAPKPPPAQVYFYPKSGQTPGQQDRDRYECFNWAVKQTGFDPSTAALTPEQRVAVTPVPAPGHDTAVGAVAGAAIGALAAGPRQTGGGALIGAAVGGIAGAASDSSRQESARHIEEAYARRDRAYNAQIEKRAAEFKRAMSACLEARGYSVR